MIFKTGQKWRQYHNKGNIANRVIHIAVTVDDDIVVYKFWKKHKKRWQYHIDSELTLENVYIKSGVWKGISK